MKTVPSAVELDDFPLPGENDKMQKRELRNSYLCV